jgi:UDP-N-acetylmuramate--alanine ligase
MVFHKIERVHFVGIGGIGMSGIAEVLINLGFKVTGSDVRRTDITERLESLGAVIFQGHGEENIIDSDVVVVSSAVRSDNPEVKKARELFIPVIQRAEMLAELMRMKYSVAVAGAHGKTTTTSLVSSILGHAGLDPTCVIGGRLNSLGATPSWATASSSSPKPMRATAPSCSSIPPLPSPRTIDLEHLDFYKDIDEIKAAFLAFLNKVPFYGVNIICIDNANIQSLIPLIKRRYMTYGLSKQAT